MSRPEVVCVPEGVSGAELSLAEFQTIKIAMLYFKWCNLKGTIAEKEIRKFHIIPARFSSESQNLGRNYFLLPTRPGPFLLSRQLALPYVLEVHRTAEFGSCESQQLPNESGYAQLVEARKRRDFRCMHLCFGARDAEG